MAEVDLHRELVQAAREGIDAWIDAMNTLQDSDEVMRAVTNITLLAQRCRHVLEERDRFVAILIALVSAAFSGGLLLVLQLAVTMTRFATRVSVATLRFLLVGRKWLEAGKAALLTSGVTVLLVCGVSERTRLVLAGAMLGVGLFAFFRALV